MSRLRLYQTRKLHLSDPRFDLSPPAAHYVRVVMRARAGDTLYLFNEEDGEFEACLETLSGRQASVCLRRFLEKEAPPSGRHLYFSPLKRDSLFFLIQKATELGVTRFHPLRMSRTTSALKARPKIEAWIVEAVEQCGRQHRPVLSEAADFKTLFPLKEPLLFLDPRRRGDLSALQSFGRWPVSFIVGPEGGFSPQEIAVFEGDPNAYPLGLSRRILRAETAAVAAAALLEIFSFFDNC